MVESENGVAGVEPPSCPVCQGPARLEGRLEDWLYRETDFRAEVARCQSCFSLFQVPLPSRDLAATFYGDGYWREQSASGLMASLQQFYVNAMLRLDLMSWFRALRLQAGDRLIDIGCSRGDWLARMARHDIQTEGLEGDGRAARFAREVQGLNVQQSSVEDWRPQASCYDAVTAFHVVEHLSDPRAFLCLCRQALKPNGRLMIRVPNAVSLQARVFGHGWKGLEPPRHLINYSPSAIKRLVREAGFEILRVSTWSLRDGPPGWSSSLFPSGEPTYQLVHNRSSSLRSLGYLLLTWGITPLEILAASLLQGGMLTLIATTDRID